MILNLLNGATPGKLVSYIEAQKYVPGKFMNAHEVEYKNGTDTACQGIVSLGAKKVSLYINRKST